MGNSRPLGWGERFRRNPWPCSWNAAKVGRNGAGLIVILVGCNEASSRSGSVLVCVVRHLSMVGKWGKVGTEISAKGLPSISAGRVPGGFLLVMAGHRNKS
jgi:hypothetical protein